MHAYLSSESLLRVLSARSAEARGLAGAADERGDSRGEEPDSIEVAVVDEVRAADCKSTFSGG